VRLFNELASLSASTASVTYLSGTLKLIRLNCHSRRSFSN
jgi:hypothetical protein